MASDEHRGSGQTIAELCLGLEMKLIDTMNSPRCAPTRHTMSDGSEPMQSPFP